MKRRSYKNRNEQIDTRFAYLKKLIENAISNPLPINLLGYFESGEFGSDFYMYLGDKDSVGNGNFILIDDSGEIASPGIVITSSNNITMYAPNGGIIFTANGANQFTLL